MVAASQNSADLFYATRFRAPDPFIYAEIAGKKILVLSDLEIDRARKEARADEILSLSKIQAVLSKRGVDQAGTLEVIDHLFKERGVTSVRVPSAFPVSLADRLRKKKYTLKVIEEPFFPDRMIKTPDEVESIRQTLRKAESALEDALEFIGSAEIRREELWVEGEPLTSELVRRRMQIALLNEGYWAREVIVVGGAQACDPHNTGSGILRAHWPIILDLFPVSLESGYCADISRTVVKGKSSEKVKRMYQAVQQGQELAFMQLKDGIDGRVVHQAILDHFEAQGFPTREEQGRMVGFFHGTGHGLGLEVHEPPRIGPVEEVLKAGQVVTVEPGLYYPDAGGIRLEDDVLIADTGCENLTVLPQFLELD